MHPQSLRLLPSSSRSRRRRSSLRTVHGSWMLASFWLLSLLGASPKVQAAVTCTLDQECQERYPNSSSVCTPSSTCSNPFQQGCFTTLQKQNSSLLQQQVFTEANASFPLRTCNSDDGTETLCTPNAFKYPEIRVHNANWESSLILSWIYQIILSELVQVPTTVGLTSADTYKSSFYSEANEWQFSNAMYPYDAVRRANQVAGLTRGVWEHPDSEEEGTVSSHRPDCSSTQLPCVDVLPEVWVGQGNEFMTLVANQQLDPPLGNGLIGRSGFFIPSFTAQAFPQFTSWYGLTGEEPRTLLAQTFGRPITWKDYCVQISSTGCGVTSTTNNPNNNNNNTAAAFRFPFPGEEDLYFHPLFYSGYFVFDESQNCTVNPDTCAGHVITPPCDWTSPIDAQLYWNNIVGLTRNGGPNQSVSGYSPEQMIQIYQAAYRTRNHIILNWYEPEPMYTEFIGTDFEMVPIHFPVPTLECLKSRVSAEARCSPLEEIRRGNSSAGACGDDIQPLQRLMAKVVKEHTQSLPNAYQSPAYNMMMHISVNNLDMNQIIRRWKRQQIDPEGNDLRVAVCEWVAGNLEGFRDVIPRGYPRISDSRSDYNAWYEKFARVMGGIAVGVTIIAWMAVIKYKDTKPMLFAQPLFLQIILLGFLLLSIGAILLPELPGKNGCVTSVWLISLGFTIELVPVIVKTAKINHLIRSYTKSNKRIQINRRAMVLKVFVVVLLVVAFLTAWTVLDPPTPTISTFLDFDGIQSGDDELATVWSDLRCASRNTFWRLMVFAIQALLLVLAAVLAFQSRHIMAQLNESKSLAVMIYSHFLFIFLRGAAYILYALETFPASEIAAAISLSYSLDAIGAMSIYVFPKILTASKAKDKYIPGRFSSMVGSMPLSTESEMEEQNPDDSHRGALRSPGPKPISILVCSANLGNKRPDGMDEWIPPGGSVEFIQCLENDTKSLSGLNSFETFGMVVIGMQEASWAESIKAAEAKNKEITEEEVLNALQGANTVALREMVQETLGDDYLQLTDERRGQMRLHIWAKRRVVKNIKDIKISGANTGIGNMLANKGGIVATVHIQNTRISFVTAHLAAHEGESYYKARCDSIRSILHEAKTFEFTPAGTSLDVATTSHHMFFLGDLNFRTKFANEQSHEENVAMAKEMIDSGRLSELYSYDELQEGLKNEDFLLGFQTLPCPFRPTFKVERVPGFVYKGQRTPSYTDRILFHSAPGLTPALQALSYEACPEFSTSDHKPIRGAFSIMPNEVDAAPVHVRGEMNLIFHKIRCSNLTPPSSTVSSSGKGDPYAMILWEGVTLNSNDNAPLHMLRRLLFGGSYWPRTSSIAKTLNPYWKGERVSLTMKDTQVRDDAMLFVVVICDSQLRGRQEVLGTATLSVKELIVQSADAPAQPSKTSHSTEEKVVDFDKQLVRDGVGTGRIKFRVAVTRENQLPHVHPQMVPANRRRSSQLVLQGNRYSTRFQPQG